MGFWFSLFLFVSTFVLNDYFRPRLPSVTPSGNGEFGNPTATEGRYVSLMFGTMRNEAPNVIWYGDFLARERTTSTGVIFKRDEVIGFTYEMSMALGLARGKAAGITGLWLGDDKVFDYVVDNGSVPSLLVDIDLPELWGGKDHGGGFKGRFRLFDGDLLQGVSAYLDDPNRIDPISGFRGFCYCVMTNQTEDAGADIGESPTMREIRIELQMFDTVANGALGDDLGLGNDHHIIGRDLNPISLAYDTWVNDDWGEAFSTSDINVANFKAAAETIFTEGLGYSQVIDNVIDVAELRDSIEQHIDGYIGPNPITGQLEVILSRDDYTPAAEFQADKTNVKSVSKWSKGEWTQTNNEILLQFTNRDKNYDDGYAPAQDLANLAIQGRPRSRTIRFSGVHTPAVANAIVWRAMKSFSRPLGVGTVELDRTAYKLRPGKIMVLTDAENNLTALSCRITAIRLGDPVKATIVAEIVEDIFGTEITAFADPPASDFIPPTLDVVPFAVADQAALEAPFIITKQDTEAQNTFPRLYTMARAAPGNNLSRYEIIRRTRTPPTGFSGAYTSIDTVRGIMTTVGKLRAAEPAWIGVNGALTMIVDPITGSIDSLIAAYAPGGVGQMNGVAVISPNTATEEWLAFRAAIDDAAGIQLTELYRGCMDSGMHVHSLGDLVWFIFTGGQGLPLEIFVEGDGIDTKLLPQSATDEVLEPAATSLAEVSLLDEARYLRPLLPAALLFNSVEFPQGNISADDVHAGPFTGILIVPSYRNWRTIDILQSVRGLSDSGEFLDTEVTADKLRTSWWLFDLDATPTPVRGVDELVSAIDVVLATAKDSIDILRSALITAGVTQDFNARLEVETSHDPAGFPAFKVSREPLKFDFALVGSWPGSLYADIYYHSHFDGADAATVTDDESDNDHTTTFVGTAQLDTAQAKFGVSSLLLDGNSDYVTVPDGAGAEFGAGDFTLEVQVRFNGDPGTATMAILAKWVETGNQRSWLLRLLNNNLHFIFSTGGTSTQGTMSRAWNPAGDTDILVTLSRKGTVLKMFIDGVQLGSDFNISTIDFFDSTALIYIGARDASGAVEFLDGWIDEVRIHKGFARYTANFTPPTTEFFFHRHYLLSDFNGADGATSLTSLDRHLHTITFNGNAQIDQAQAKFGSGSLLLDGSGDFATVPDGADLAFGSGDFTVECFVRFAALPSSTADGMCMASQYLNSGNQRGWFFAVNDGDELEFFWTIDGINSQLLAATDTPTVLIDVWYHVAVAREGANLRLFFGGTLLSAAGDSISGDTLHDSTTTIRLGSIGSAGFDRFLNGWLDEVRVTTGRAIYTAGFTPPSAPHPRD